MPSSVWEGICLQKTERHWADTSLHLLLLKSSMTILFVQNDNENVPKSIKNFLKLVQHFDKYLIKPWRNGQILLKFCQGGKISSYLVTLTSYLSVSPFNISFFFWKMGHPRPLFLYFSLFNTWLTVNKCSI